MYTLLHWEFHVFPQQIKQLAMRTKMVKISLKTKINYYVIIGAQNKTIINSFNTKRIHT